MWNKGYGPPSQECWGNKVVAIPSVWPEPSSFASEGREFGAGATKKIPRQKRPKSIGREERGPWRGNDGPRALSLVGQLISPARLWMKAVKVVDQQIAPSSARYCRRPSCDWPLLPTEPHSWRTHWPGVRLCKVSAQIWQFPNFHAQCKSWTFSESIKI